MSNFDPRDYGDFFDENEPYIQPLDEKAPAPKPEQPPKKPKKKKGKGCLIAIAVFFILGFIGMMMNSCGGGSSSSSSTKTEQTQEEQSTEQKAAEEAKEETSKDTTATGDTATYQKYADQSKAYYNEFMDAIDRFSKDKPSDKEMEDYYSDLSTRISKTEAEIPEDTTDQVLRTERAMLDKLNKLAVMPFAIELTDPDQDEVTATIQKTLGEYRTLTEQIPEYYEPDPE